MSGARGLLIIAFVAAAALSMVNVSAYQQVSVSSGMSVTVTNTGSAALALTSSSPMASGGDTMSINFQLGNGGTRSFLSTHTTGGVTVTGDLMQMRDVFRVTNNGTQCQNVAVYVSGGTPTNLSAIYGRIPTDALPGTQLAGSLGVTTGSVVNLGVAGSGKNQMIADVHWSAGSATAAGNFTIQVSSAYTASCPP